jgi:hypothetical protein
VSTPISFGRRRMRHERAGRPSMYLHPARPQLCRSSVLSPYKHPQILMYFDVLMRMIYGRKILGCKTLTNSTKPTHTENPLEKVRGSIPLGGSTIG